MPRRVAEQSSHAADLIIETVPEEFSLILTGMISLREVPLMAALKTLSDGIITSAQREALNNFLPLSVYQSMILKRNIPHWRVLHIICSGTGR